MDRTRPWADFPLVAFDTETTGAYPVGSEIVEFGAVKWFQGQIVDQLQILIKPKTPMGDFVIGIHGITNEMVENCPPMEQVVPIIFNFMKDSIVMAHHAPFDMGFVCYSFEKYGLQLPHTPVFCTSLISRKLIKGTINHKLQTLVQHLKIDGGTAHRASDDAKACLEVGLHCLNLLPADASIQLVLDVQEKKIEWPYYSLKFPKSLAHQALVEALEHKKNVNIIYNKGSQSGKMRPVQPLGIVRNPDGDYLSAICLLDQQKKRFYLQNLIEAEPIP